jgi:hypothetical protein
MPPLPGQNSLTTRCLLVLALGVTGAVPVWAEEPKSLDDKIMEIAGTAEFLRAVPKHFATLKAADSVHRTVTLLIEGESLPKVWPLAPDAEVKRSGWWGRLDQFQLGDRVWAWFQTNRANQPVAISMLADELSEQDIHGPGVVLEARDADSLTFKLARNKTLTLKANKAEVYLGTDKATLDSLKIGDKYYLQSHEGEARLILDSSAFEARRAEQKLALRKRWAEEGLPGAVTFLHRFSGEMEFMLDHEAMRWGRSLKPGDKVTLQETPPIEALVKVVKPWHEHTQVHLVVNGIDQADLSPGQRMFLRMTAPPLEVDTAVLPPDCDRPRSREERLEWFLATIYCVCTVRSDVCTGMFYTLASCNPNACGMPRSMRQTIGEKIDKGLTDKQILEELLKESGPVLLRPHLLP